MNKFATSILETLGYFLMTAGFSSLITAFSYGPEMILTSLLGSIMFLVIGVALIKWELRIESKRTEQVKHYDYMILIGLAVMSFLGMLISFFGSASPYGNGAMRGGNIINQFVMGICFLAFGFYRKSMYSTESTPTSEKTVDMSKKAPKD